MTPSRLLLSGRLGAGVADAIGAALPEVEVRFRSDPSVEDLKWADSFSGFAWPCGVTPASAGVKFDWVHGMGAGTDAFTAHRSRIGTLSRTVGDMPTRMGRFVLALLLHRQHHLASYRAAQARREWLPQPTGSLPHNVVVLGAGVVAAGIAEVLTQHGCHVLGVNSTGLVAPGFVETCSWSAALDRIARAELVVNALPLTQTTVGLVDATLLRRLDGATFINVGRGPTIDTDALREALDGGAVVHAHLDVFDHEPLPEDSWLWGHPKVAVTPHVAAQTREHDVVEALTQTYDDLRQGKPLRWGVPSR